MFSRIEKKQVSISRRRNLLTLIFGLISPLWAGLTLARSERPVQAFRDEALPDALISLFGTKEISQSDKIRVVAAKLAENGAVVPVKVETDFEHVNSITLLASKNPVPLIARFEFAENVMPFIATRIKLAESSEIIAVAETAEGLFLTRRHVEVTIGGCGA